MTAVWSVLAGGLVVAGAVLAMLWWFRFDFGRWRLPRFRHVPLAIASTLVFAAAFLATGWVVGGVHASVAFFFGVYLFTERRRRGRVLSKVEATADWIEAVRDALASSSGLEQAMRRATSRAPKALKVELMAFDRNLEHRGLSAALVELRKDVQVDAMDRAAVSIAIASQVGSGQLVLSLSEIARIARRDVAQRLLIESERSGLRSQANTISGISILVVVLSIAFRRESLRAYDSLGGQIALAITGGLLAIGLVGFNLLALQRLPQRALENQGGDLGREPGVIPDNEV